MRSAGCADLSEGNRAVAPRLPGHLTDSLRLFPVRTVMRSLLAGLLLISFLALAGVPMEDALAGDDKPKPPRPRAPVKLTPEAERIHKEALLIDGHNDLPWQFRKKRDLSFLKIDLRKDQTALGLHTDIPRLKKGNVG